MNIVLRFTGIAAILAMAIACADSTPRRAANPGVSTAPGSERALNAPYYQGADPDFPRGTGGSRSRP
jgi:hypothetical protein